MNVIRNGIDTASVMRSTDKGLTWGAPISISNIGALGARDPVTGAPIRDGAILRRWPWVPTERCTSCGRTRAYDGA
jgi:hypothetical protein